MRSIRATLVLWLVGALAVGSLAVLAATYWLTREQVKVVFDEELRQVALAVHLREDWTDPRLRIARPGFALAVRAYDEQGKTYFETALPSLPEDLPQRHREGFERAVTREGTWRVYTHVGGLGVVQVGQSVAARDALARDLALRLVAPLLVLMPLLVALVAWLLTRALRPLEHTSRLVSDRDAARLDPLPVEGVPAELRPLVEQINALLGRLAASLDSERRFLADVAHELRSPVAALALQVQIARRAQSAQARASAFEELERGIERARRLVQQLLDFARLDSAQPWEPHRSVDLAAVARDAVAACFAQAERRGVDLGAEAAEPMLVRGAEAELHSLVSNLVDNALRYSPRGGAVTVSVRVDGPFARLQVVDAGPGIRPAERARVFERFHRAAGDPTAGTGLGLAIVKAITERHGGTIELGDAQPGAASPGLAVTVRLPRLEDAAAQPLKPRLRLARAS